MECLKCTEADHWADAVYCHQCGTRLKNLCSNESCEATDLSNHFRYCPICGTESLFALSGLMAAGSETSEGEAGETMEMEEPRAQESREETVTQETSGEESAEETPEAQTPSELESADEVEGEEVSPVEGEEPEERAPELEDAGV